MEKKKIFKVLSPCKPLFKILTAFDNKIDWRVVSFDISLPFIISIILCGTCLMLILLIWFCFDNKFDLKKISTTITFFISVIQMCSVSIFFYGNKQFISETFDLLQNIVEQRKYTSLCAC